ncbi:hypothetical protein OGAPHI_000279 [Ogataea philodendri]|uniref:Uncharacterized protein n=1 Tax=Ogataea philodendri TaxID=1378263 RepID=A0A9P8PGN0_9ASCO|nr:uncharacterized protein OGAPHI_000279 [Ogataea philodendri]KAH3671576.1 hypothetical protein OGAPHI_000279 [Ogataea philodendri]
METTLTGSGYVSPKTALNPSNKRTLLVNAVTQNLSESKVKNVSTSVVVSNRPSSELVIASDNVVSNGKSTFHNVTSVQDVTSVALDVLNLKLSNSVNDDLSGVVLLASLLSIEWRLFQQDTKLLTLLGILGGCEKLLAVINSNNLGLNVFSAIFVNVISGWNILVSVQRSQHVNIKFQKGLSGFASGSLRSLQRSKSCLFKAFFIDFESGFLSHQSSKIHWESISVIKSPNVSSDQCLFWSL